MRLLVSKVLDILVFIENHAGSFACEFLNIKLEKNRQVFILSFFFVLHHLMCVFHLTSHTDMGKDP